jgi:magnesium transporter
VGTQTEVLAVRGLAVGVSIREIVFKELLAGFLIGVCISAAFFPFCLLLYGDASLAVAVSVALLVSATMASVVALVLPWILSSMGKDPAFGSGPISTVIQDLLSIAIYLALATMIV